VLSFRSFQLIYALFGQLEYTVHILPSSNQHNNLLTLLPASRLIGKQFVHKQVLLTEICLDYLVVLK
jgi:hypothetical protein